jgi:WD40 repeat protein
MFRTRVCFLIVGLLAAPSAALAGTEVTGVAFTPDGNILVAVSLDGSITFWDVAKAAERLRVEAHKNGIYGMALSPDGKLLATAGGDRFVRLWDLKKIRELYRLEGHEKEVVGVAFSPDSKMLASCGYDQTVRLWDCAGGQELAKLQGHELRVTTVAFSPDGKVLASGGIAKAETPNFRGSTQGDQIRLWDPASRQPIRQLPVRGHHVAFSPDGRTLVAAGMYLNFLPAGGGFTIDGGSRISLWDVERGKERLKIDEYWHAIALSADGRYLASGWGSRLHMGGIVLKGSKGKGIHLCETASGKEVLQIAVPEDRATALAISPDGKKLAAGRQDGQVDFWELTPRSQLAKKPDGNLEAKGLEKLWTDLASSNPQTGYEAIWLLAEQADKSVPFLKERLQPAAPLEARFGRMVADLDSKEFAVRESASQELAKIGAQAAPLLRKALEGKPSPEMRRRVTALLAQLEDRTLQPEELQRGRALHLLEQIGNPAAQELLKKLAAGAPEADLTQDAQAALQRLARRATKTIELEKDD